MAYTMKLCTFGPESVMGINHVCNKMADMHYAAAVLLAVTLDLHSLSNLVYTVLVIELEVAGELNSVGLHLFLIAFSKTWSKQDVMSLYCL